MSGNSGGACVPVHAAQGPCREKRGCTDGKDEPELSLLCRADEPNELFCKQAQCVEK